MTVPRVAPSGLVETPQRPWQLAFPLVRADASVRAHHRHNPAIFDREIPLACAALLAWMLRTSLLVREYVGWTQVSHNPLGKAQGNAGIVAMITV